MAVYLNFLEASCLVSLNQIIFCHVLPEINNVHTPHTRDKKFQGEGVSASAGGGAGKLKYHWERVLENLSFKGAFVLISVTLISSILFWQSITW